MRAALTIAGSDSSAGAGIQADLKTFAALGVYGTSAITAVTSQNTSGVSDVFVLPPEVVRHQIQAVATDLALSAVKTGMLATPDIVLTVAEAIARLALPNLVVDPVLAAASGARRTLLSPEAVSTLKTRLAPLAFVITPNVAEAEVLSNVAVTSLKSAREAAKRIFDLGPRAVIVKGGHMDDARAIDVLFDGHAFIELSAPRFSRGPLHGTGCTFASAIAAGLALGDDLVAAAERAKRYVTGAIEHATPTDAGGHVLNHFWLY
ncbi:MAG: bifunctional hydroxymethylpyrimidine kinase/phosphomethylpyrimidine kinase [Vicinamibacterales bacterium]|nr:bifunctional hydroxymethylpyrimidine kinase/phosphomethylpyrimidine kinase [Vicinamibacterales bacterium]